MAFGPGKYDHLCTHAREQAKAAGAVLIILNGEHGHGMSCQADLASTLVLPELLEEVAAKIRASMQKGEL